VTILAVLAADTNSTSSINDVEPGLLAFLVVAGLGIALVFLLRSMNKQFRKIGPRPEDIEAEAADEAGDGEAVDGGDAEVAGTAEGSVRPGAPHGFG
jgi:hypothetical protein